MDFLECPICEEQFSENTTDQVVTCPGCQRKFLASSASRVNLGIKPSRKALPRPDFIDQNVEKQAKEKEEIEAKPLKLTAPAQESKPADPRAFSERTAKVRVKSQQRRKKRFAVTIIASLAFAVVSGILGGILVMQMSKKNPELADQGNNSNPTPETQNNNSDTPVTPKDPFVKATDPFVKTKPNAKSPEPENDVPVRLEDLPEQKFRLLKGADLDDCWDTVRPHLVTLNVHDVRGTHEAVGTIIDSRGWIVTSYHAIKGATKIEVVSSPKVIDDLYNDHLTDEVRGIVTTASNPELDLAVLAINRRFVISFADIKMALFKRVVQGVCLAQCAPPSKQNLYGRTEAKINARSRFDSLPNPEKVESKELESTDISWLIAESDTQPLPGTPLTSIDGELAAINVFSEGKKAYYVMLEALDKLIDESDGVVDPLSTLGGMSTDAGTVQINQFHPFLEQIQRLNQLGDQCKEMDWIATEPEQYSLLQEFGKQVYTARNYLKTNPDGDEDLLAPVEEQLLRWQNTLFERISRPNKEDRERIKEMNSLAEQQLKSGDQCVVFYGAALAPDLGSDRLLFRIDELDSGVSVPFDPEADPKRPDVPFLLFVMTPTQSRRINYTLPLGVMTAYSAELFFDVGPLDE